MWGRGTLTYVVAEAVGCAKYRPHLRTREWLLHFCSSLVCVHGFHGVELGMRMISMWARLRGEMSRWRYLKRRMSFADDRAGLPTESKVAIERHGRLDFGRS
jgi:hypothetical protein